MDLAGIDSIYERYGYEVKKHHEGVRVYVFTKSIYNGADILSISKDSDVETIRKSYAEQGYAVKVKHYKTVDEAELDLFKDFFKADGVLAILEKRYGNFIGRLMEKLPDNAQYEYIHSPFEITLYNNSEIIYQESFEEVDADNSIVNKTIEYLQNHNGPLFVIIEAAAGYGKTCTAYEILNSFLKFSKEKLPFFTELSRDRKATIFRHILLNEIEEQFSRSITSDVVVHEIKAGRIPLIIDGFDELISKDFSFATTEFQQVESMLSTIVDLLSGNAKIVITSRKTAIFNSEEFLGWMESKNINYSLLRITISEPKINNWLAPERMEIINNSEVPVQSFANPVLLTYLRYISIGDFKNSIVEKKTIVDEYLNFLLEREQVRQGLPMEPAVQLRIFKKIVRLFTEFDIKSTNKEDLQDLILDYNKDILENALRKYSLEKKPTLNQLANTLTNHAFLDKKDNKSIGFVNEFILGTLLGDNLVQGDYERHHREFYYDISQAYSLLTLQSYKVQPQHKKEILWSVYNKFPFKYEQQFFFKIDLDLANKVERNFVHATFSDFEVNDILLINQSQFVESTFTNCIFRNCIFNPISFVKSSFVSCKFYDCSLDDSTICSPENMIFFGCSSNNDFDTSNDAFDDIIYEPLEENNIEKTILEMHFKVGTLKARFRTLSQIREDLKEYFPKDIDRALRQLELDKYININGNNSHISNLGISYYNDKYRKNL